MIQGGLREPTVANSLFMDGKSDNAGVKHKNPNNQQTNKQNPTDHGKPVRSAKEKVFVLSQQYCKNTQPFESVRPAYVRICPFPLLFYNLGQVI